jgi:hypothetical protein
MKQKIKIDPLEYKLVSILFFLLMLLFLFTACNKEETIQQPECKNCTVVHEDNRREAQLRCLGLAHSIDRFEVRNITSEYHCRPFPTTKVETFNQCSGVVWTKRIRYECN